MTFLTFAASVERLRTMTIGVGRMGRGDRSALVAAGTLWCLGFALMIGLLLAGRLDSIPYHVYAAAGRRWLAHAPLYETETIDGFQYFPQSALLLAPFAWFGSPWGDVAWRATNWALYALGIWRVSRLLAPNRAPACFLLATCLAIASATGSLGNGQANLAIAALTLHVAAELMQQHWWLATAILALGFALKPLMVVLLLLVWVVYRPMAWRIPLALGSVFGVPWLLRDNAYVMAQYAACATKLSMCAAPDRLFEDLRGLLATFGWLMPHSTYWVVRLVAAACVLLTVLWTRRRVPEPHASFLLAGFAGSYLMLFNPRTLSTSYVMTVSFAAIASALYLLQRRVRAALAALSIVLAWTISYRVFSCLEHWLRPLACIAFGALLTCQAFERQSSVFAVKLRAAARSAV